MPVLYHLTLQKPTAIVNAVHGNFSAPRAQEVIVSHGRTLELLRPDEEGKAHSICSTDVFGIIRSVAAFRLTGAMKDYIVLGSDSGRLVIVEFNAKKNCFERVHCETYGKTGVRRAVAGEYVAVDPRGRALMVAALERQKFVYILNRDSKAALTISSPLEAHKSNVLCADLCGVDVGFENPLFATLEQPYPPPNKQGAPPPGRVLCFWEMDLGLNHVVKKSSSPVPSSAHCLIPVPGGGGNDGPSGVLVCCENLILYRKIDHEEVACAIPRRLEMGSDRGLVVVSFAVHRMKGFFFVLLQSEFGDIYKVEIAHEEGTVREITCRYFDTVPVANALCVLKSGYLFVAAEFGNHHLYQFTGIGTDESDPRCSSSHPLGRDAIIAFKPRGLKNLALADELPSLSPATDMHILDAQGTGAPQLYLLCGRGPRSSLRILQHGLAVEELADNELPGKPRAVWTLKQNNESLYDAYILVAFEGSSLVLQIGETVEEVADSQFITNATTLHASLLADDSFVQVLETEVRHVHATGGGVSVWKPPGGRRIKVASANERQLALGLSGGDLVFFELDETGALAEVAKKSLHVETTCLGLQPVPPGRTRASFVAAGGLDNVVRILSVDKDKQLKQVATQLLPNNATPESVCLAALQAQTAGEHFTYLYVGLNTGVMIRSSVDPVTGTLSDQRTRFLGGRAARFHLVRMGNRKAVMALSEKSWLSFFFQSKFHFAPLHYDPLECVASFSSEQADGFVAIAGGSLRIFRCQRLSDVFSPSILPLSYTPRSLAVLPHVSAFSSTIDTGDGTVRKIPALAICEADHNAYDEATKVEIRRALKGIKLNHEEESEDMQLEDSEDLMAEDSLGTFKAGSGKWGSCLRIVNPLLATTIEKLTFETDEAAISCCCCEFEGLPLLIVGTVTGMTLRPKKVAAASIKVYAYDNNFRLTFLHSTPVEDVPQCFAPFRGMLLAGVGNRLRLYALGKKRLLRKCEYKNLPSCLVFLRVYGDRIFAGDMSESVHVLKYKVNANLFHVLCDDSGPRWLTRGEVLDYHTIVAADKFDSLFIARVPSEARQDELGDVTGLKLRGDTAYMTDSCHKLDTVLQFHVGEGVTGLRRAALSTGSSEAIVYATIMGTIGALVPFLTKEELDFFHHLEMVMRSEAPPLAGRDHLMFRSYYHPLKNVVDGDLCEQFSSLSAEAQTRVAQDFEKTPADILKRLEDIRNRVL
ncbi:hypothetical protein Efla_002450 [Eimeria flavescens]